MLATIRWRLLFCPYDGQKIEKMVSLLMRYVNY